jgi:enterochelin esterase family protein
MEITITPPAFARALISDGTDMHRSPRPLDGSGKPITLTLPDDVWFEYAFLDGEGKAHADPANPLRADNPWYPEVSAVRGPAHAFDALYQQAATEPEHGRLDRQRIESAVLDQTRRITLYTPAGMEDRPLPAILVQDGQAFLRVGHLARVLDALLAAGQVRPVRLVFIDPVDRNVDYLFNDAYGEFITAELLPALGELTPGVTDLDLLGASLGGLASATLALARPELYAGVATLSGAFLGTPANPDPYGSRESWLLERIRSASSLPARWFVATGTLEWLTEINREAAAALRERGVQLHYEERSAGHNWTNWRGLLGDALRHLLAG